MVRLPPAEAAGTSGPSAEDEDWALTKRRAIIAGLDFIRSLGLQLFRNEALAERHGADILVPFFVPQSSMAATEEERHALSVASELAAEWHSRTKARRLPPKPAPSVLLDLMQGLYSIECIGRSDCALRQQLAERAARWGPTDFFRYNPLQGDPPAGVREDCPCGAKVACAAKECATCRRPAVAMNRFDVWLEALVWSFHGCRMRIGLGCCFFDVLRQVGPPSSGHSTFPPIIIDAESLLARNATGSTIRRPTHAPPHLNIAGMRGLRSGLSAPRLPPSEGAPLPLLRPYPRDLCAQQLRRAEPLSGALPALGAGVHARAGRHQSRGRW